MEQNSSKILMELEKRKENNSRQMQPTSTSEETTLLSLPEEVVHQIVGHLERQDLIALSSTCTALRTSLNRNYIWRKYSRAGSVHLRDITSIVPPTFSEPEEDSSSLEDLCDSRMRILRESRLKQNIRKGLFVEQTVNLTTRLSLGEFRKYIMGSTISSQQHLPINFRQIIYKNQYLFALSGNQTLEVFVINDTIKPLSSFLLPQQDLSDFDNRYASICVVGDLLIARSLTVFDVYKVTPPDCSLTFLHTISCFQSCSGPSRGSSGSRMANGPDDVASGRRVRLELPPINILAIASHYIFRVPTSVRMPFVQVWDLTSGNEVNPILPKRDGENFNILRFSLNEKYILLSVGLNSIYSKDSPYLFVFSIESLEYTDFCTELEPSLNQTFCVGLIDDKYVVLISLREQHQPNRFSNYSVDIYVFDLLTSDVLVRKLGAEYDYRYSLHLVNGLLVVPSFQTIKVMSPANLETVWEMEDSELKSIEFITSPSGFFHLMVLAKSNNLVEFWDFENRKKCFTLTSADSFTMDDTFCKLIVEKYKDTGCERELKVLNFW